MKPITPLPMNIMAVLMSGLLCLSGCAVKSNELVEKNTPTGCLKSQARYYDPKTKQCVTVNDRQTALVLDAYRYVNKLAEEGKLQEAEYNIYPKKHLTVDEAEVLWAELKAMGAKMIVLGGGMPDNREYDPEPGNESPGLKKYIGTPRVWGGGGVSLSCGWLMRDDPPSDTIQGMLTEALKTIEKEDGRPRPQLRKAILEDKECRIDNIKVSANPKLMLDWVNRHLDDLTGVRPEVNNIDKVMPQLGPLGVTKEGE